MLKVKSFIIDAGHGGKYDGTTSGSRKEKVVTLNMSKILEKKLKAKGATVYMTRTTDKLLHMKGILRSSVIVYYF
ncbi:N-acetylmuramoyl-L-alanine amidase [Lysinibacillus sp. NPDC048646]|uniref:N-acetylmuramoyl-L-alanine amidase n=1 Tax=Lysinibacillus sp. NPDC048646 TaxID=3390574 RepID=UPI003CFE090E